MMHHTQPSCSSQSKLVCVGYGNMACAMLRGIIESGLFGDYEIFVAGRDLQKAQSLCDSLMSDNPRKDSSTRPHLKALCVDSHTSLNIQDCEVLLCVKPHAFGVFAYIGEARIVYSVMAGVRVDTLARVLQARSFVRIMPNVGALYAKSASCVYMRSMQSDTKDIESAVHRLVESFGNCVIVDNESLIDASIATSGSAPAFLAVVAQSLIDSGIYHGLSYAQSRELVAQTFSFTEAAAIMGTSVAVVSRSIAALERKLGVRLLQRSTRQVTVTAAGLELVPRLQGRAYRRGCQRPIPYLRPAVRFRGRCAWPPPCPSSISIS